MSKNSNIAVIIPTYNEKENVAEIIKQIHTSVPDVSIYIVDDNSPDGTSKIVSEIERKNNRVHLIKRTKKNGRGGAVFDGFAHALKDKKIEYVMEMDADLSHSPEEISRLLAKKNRNFIVVGSRYVQGSKIINWPMRRIVMSGFANRYIRLVLGIPMNDFTNGFRLYPRDAAEFLIKCTLKHKGFIALSESIYLLYKKNFKIVEVPITFVDRRKGKSNATFSEVLKSLYAVLQIRMFSK